MPAVMSEWMRVMLEEIARKKEEEEQARLEEQRRSEEARASRNSVVLQSAQCTS
jgi:hypothetical protein